MVARVAVNPYAAFKPRSARLQRRIDASRSVRRRTAGLSRADSVQAAKKDHSGRGCGSVAAMLSRAHHTGATGPRSRCFDESVSWQTSSPYGTPRKRGCGGARNKRRWRRRPGSAQRGDRASGVGQFRSALERLFDGRSARRSGGGQLAGGARAAQAAHVVAARTRLGIDSGSREPRWRSACSVGAHQCAATTNLASVSDSWRPRRPAWRPADLQHRRFRIAARGPWRATMRSHENAPARMGVLDQPSDAAAERIRQ